MFEVQSPVGPQKTKTKKSLMPCCNRSRSVGVSVRGQIQRDYIFVPSNLIKVLIKKLHRGGGGVEKNQDMRKSELVLCS